MAYLELPDSLIPVGNPVKHDIFERIKTNQNDFDDRLGNLEGSTAKVIVFNDILRRSTEHKVGDIKFSFLSEVEFQNQFDDTWILCDGRAVSGSDYHNITANSNIPDMRGRFPRVKDHGAGVNPDGNLSLGITQGDTFKSHTHTDSGHVHSITDVQHTHDIENDGHTHPITDVTHTHSVSDSGHNHTLHDPGHGHAFIDPGHRHSITTGDGDGGSRDLCADGEDHTFTSTAYTNYSTTGLQLQPSATSIYLDAATSNLSVDNSLSGLSGTQSSTTGGNLSDNYSGITGANSNTANIQNTGSDETRPKCITINAFIKINESSTLKRLIFRAPYAFNLLGATINNLIAGTDGDVSIDIKKGNDLNSLASVFTTKPSLNYTAGNYANSNNAVFGTVAIAAGDWLVLDIESFQKYQKELHIYVTGEV